MGSLPDPGRIEAWADWMRENADPVGLTKAELRDAVNATDDWIEANQAAYNAALPVAARSILSTKQKALLFMFVASHRFEVF